MTQLHDGVDGLGDARYGDGRRRAGRASDGEPLFEQLRDAYLRGADSGEWERGQETAMWVPDRAEEWARGLGLDGRSASNGAGGRVRGHDPDAWAGGNGNGGNGARRRGWGADGGAWVGRGEGRRRGRAVDPEAWASGEWDAIEPDGDWRPAAGEGPDPGLEEWAPGDEAEQEWAPEPGGRQEWVPGPATGRDWTPDPGTGQDWASDHRGGQAWAPDPDSERDWTPDPGAGRDWAPDPGGGQDWAVEGARERRARLRVVDVVDDERLDQYEDDNEDEGWDEPAVVRERRGDRAERNRIAWRRTSTLLNVTTVLVSVAVLLAAGAVGLLIVSSRLLTTRQLFFMAHSAFGIIIVHAFGGGLGTLITTGESRLKDRIRKLSTVAMAVVAWLASATGTWFGYAGYRAPVPPGGNLELYPREYLLHSPGLRFWETFAMEWKVHIGWTTPFLATSVAFVVLRYRQRLVADSQVRKVLTNLFIIAFAGAVVAAVLGAMVNVIAPNDFMHRGWHP